MNQHNSSKFDPNMYHFHLISHRSICGSGLGKLVSLYILCGRKNYDTEFHNLPREDGKLGEPDSESASLLDVWCLRIRVASL